MQKIFAINLARSAIRECFPHSEQEIPMKILDDIAHDFHRARGGVEGTRKIIASKLGDRLNCGIKTERVARNNTWVAPLLWASTPSQPGAINVHGEKALIGAQFTFSLKKKGNIISSLAALDKGQILISHHAVARLFERIWDDAHFNSKTRDIGVKMLRKAALRGLTTAQLMSHAPAHEHGTLVIPIAKGALIGHTIQIETPVGRTTVANMRTFISYTMMDIGQIKFASALEHFHDTAERSVGKKRDDAISKIASWTMNAEGRRFDTRIAQDANDTDDNSADDAYGFGAGQSDPLFADRLRSVCRLNIPGAPASPRSAPAALPPTDDPKATEASALGAHLRQAAPCAISLPKTATAAMVSCYRPPVVSRRPATLLASIGAPA